MQILHIATHESRWHENVHQMRDASSNGSVVEPQWEVSSYRSEGSEECAGVRRSSAALRLPPVCARAPLSITDNCMDRTGDRWCAFWLTRDVCETFKRMPQTIVRRWRSSPIFHSHYFISFYGSKGFEQSHLTSINVIMSHVTIQNYGKIIG